MTDRGGNSDPSFEAAFLISPHSMYFRNRSALFAKRLLGQGGSLGNGACVRPYVNLLEGLPGSWDIWDF